MSSEPVTDTIIEKNVDLLRSRHLVGMLKYGVSLDNANHTPTEWVQHAIEETADKLNYLQKLKARFIPSDSELDIILEALGIHADHSWSTSDKEAAKNLKLKICRYIREL